MVSVAYRSPECVEVSHPMPPHSAKKVLLVDDRRENVVFIKHFLVSKGYDVHVAHSGLNALEDMSASRPDIVMLDLEMPGMSGLEVLKTMRSSATLASTPVVIISGHSKSEFETECRAAGANDVIEKPVRLGRLSELIASLLE